MRAPVRFMLRRSVARIASEMAGLYWRVLKRESGRPMWPIRPSWSKARGSSGADMTMTARTVKTVQGAGGWREVHDRLVGLVGRECLAPSVALGLLPHRRPDVCVDHRCLLEIFDVVLEIEVVVALLWIVVGRRDDRQDKAGDGC